MSVAVGMHLKPSTPKMAHRAGDSPDRADRRPGSKQSGLLRQSERVGLKIGLRRVRHGAGVYRIPAGLRAWPRPMDSPGAESLGRRQSYAEAGKFKSSRNQKKNVAPPRTGI